MNVLIVKLDRDPQGNVTEKSFRNKPRLCAINELSISCFEGDSDYWLRPRKHFYDDIRYQRTQIFETLEANAFMGHERQDFCDERSKTFKCFTMSIKL